MVISFTTLTLALGAPIYDKLSESVDPSSAKFLNSTKTSRAESFTRAAPSTFALIAISGTWGSGALCYRIRPRRRSNCRSGGLGNLRRLDT